MCKYPSDFCTFFISQTHLPKLYNFLNKKPQPTKQNPIKAHTYSTRHLSLQA